MGEKWTGRLRGHMFNEGITVRELAEAVGWSYGYVSAILNGKRNRQGARQVLEEAYERILKQRKEARRRAPSGTAVPAPPNLGEPGIM